MALLKDIRIRWLLWRVKKEQDNWNNGGPKRNAALMSLCAEAEKILEQSKPRCRS